MTWYILIFYLCSGRCARPEPNRNSCAWPMHTVRNNHLLLYIIYSFRNKIIKKNITIKTRKISISGNNSKSHRNCTPKKIIIRNLDLFYVFFYIFFFTNYATVSRKKGALYCIFGKCGVCVCMKYERNNGRAKQSSSWSRLLILVIFMPHVVDSVVIIIIIAIVLCIREMVRIFIVTDKLSI